ncbi:hypothetical protein B1A_01599 [mine drainage metagenome]|uniref:Uncharacterized protein n=2 Tax=mine drainage metagenome TaxID=410659 RepID=T1DE71_9ZZZZ
MSRGKGFAELFALWHGRQPTDDEWAAPRKTGARGDYVWQAPELALLASLVGRLGVAEIAKTLTHRLRERTGDPHAKRTRVAVNVRINKIGLQSTDVLGGITVAMAAREIRSLAIVQQAIRSKQLRAVRVGRIWVIQHTAWAEWKASRIRPPDGYVQLSSLRERLAIRSDKLSEFARMGYVPTAVRCNPCGTGVASTQFGTWYVDKKIAEKLLVDRAAGLPMPWHGKPMADNLRATFKLWVQRKHPASCKTCSEIWGKSGAPRSYEDYAVRYPPLAQGAKRHLTWHWNPGLTIRELAAEAGCSVSHVRLAIGSGALAATRVENRRYVSRTDATRWRARKCPAGNTTKSWISLETAQNQYLFTFTELRGFIANGELVSKTGTDGAARGVVYVSRHQCGQLREKIGFTEEQAAHRVGVLVPQLQQLLIGVNWRKATGIPLRTVQAVIKRLESRAGYTLEEAAAKLDVTVGWIIERQHEGVIKVSQVKWDRRRVYITEPMLQRLREARHMPVVRDAFTADWLRLNDASREAGVTPATLIKWAAGGELDRRRSKSGWRYPRESVRVRARSYWKSVRFHRATPPDWLLTEAMSADA